MKRTILFMLITVASAISPNLVCAVDDWRIIAVGNRDYLTLDNVASFYNLHPQMQGVNNHLILGDSQVRLESCSNPREVYINGVKQWLSFPMLTENGQLLVSRFDLAKTIEPCLRPTLISNLRPFQTVVLDAGHGGQDGGGHSVSGLEKDYTFEVIANLKKSLEERGLKVILTRNDDTYLPLEDRAARANAITDSIFVSIHFNSSTDPGAAGVEVFSMTPRGAASTADMSVTSEQFKQTPGNDFDDASLALGTCVQHSLLGHLPQVDRGVKRARFAVLRLTHAPAILIEGGFLTNPDEGQRINDGIWREKFAEAVAAGVQSFQNVADRKSPPKLVADYRSEQLPLSGTIVNPALQARDRSSRAESISRISNPSPNGTGVALSPRGF